MLWKKKTNILLIGLVAIIWSFIGYQIWSHFILSDFPDYIGQEVSRKPTKDSTYENYEPYLKYLDPFLRNTRKAANVTIENKALKPILKRHIRDNKLTVDRAKEAVKFLGIVKNDQKVITVAIIKVLENLLFVKEGQRIDSISVITIKKDSILIGYKGNQFWIKKK